MSERNSLDYAREILEASLILFHEIKTDPVHFAKVAPAVNGAMLAFIAAEQMELRDPSR